MPKTVMMLENQKIKFIYISTKKIKKGVFKLIKIDYIFFK